MVEPSVSQPQSQPDPDDDGDDDTEIAVEVDQAANASPEVHEAMAEPVPNDDGFLGEDGNEGFFDGVEGGQQTTDHDHGQGQGQGQGQDAMDADPFGEFSEGEDDMAMGAVEAEPEPHSFEEPINAGAARLAVVGIEDDDQQDSLNDEFEEVFEEFQLGHYGSETMHEYVLTDADDIDPIWGLCGSMLLCTAIVVWMRPDGDELIADARENLATMRGTAGPAGGSLS